MGCILLRDVYVRNYSTNIPAIPTISFISVAIVIASQHANSSKINASIEVAMVFLR
jgi:hypothetical protein